MRPMQMLDIWGGEASPGVEYDGVKLSGLQWSDKKGEVKLSSEWHKSVRGRIDAQIILYAKTGAVQYITLPERDIETAGDTAILHRGKPRVFFFYWRWNGNICRWERVGYGRTALKNERMQTQRCPRLIKTPITLPAGAAPLTFEKSRRMASQRWQGREDFI